MRVKSLRDKVRILPQERVASNSSHCIFFKNIIESVLAIDNVFKFLNTLIKLEAEAISFFFQKSFGE